MDENTLILNGVIESLRNQYAEPLVNLWFSSMKVLSIENDKVKVLAESEFKKITLVKRYSEVLNRVFSEQLGRTVNVEVVSDEAPVVVEEKVEPEEKKTKEIEYYSSAGNTKYTFDNFVVGNSNRLAYSTSRAVAESPAQMYNPLFIYGSSGLGKTHLLFAILNKTKEFNPKFKILYITGEDFTNQLIDALTQKKTNAFKDKFRNADLLLVDDVQFISGKDATQEEFFHTFNALYQQDKQIILTSDRPPKDIPILADRLRTRFESGLIIDIQPPDEELRVAIFKSKAAELNISLPNEVLTYLAVNIKTNIRQIEGAIKTLKARSFISDKPITLDMTKDVLSDFLKNIAGGGITVDDILSSVAKKYNIQRDALTGKRRSAEIVHARQVAIYIIHELTNLSYKNIGKIFDRDHTTIMYSCDMIAKQRQENPDFYVELSNLFNSINTI